MIATDSADQKNLLRPHDADFAVAAYREIAFIRAFEKKVLDLSTENPPRIIGSVHLCAGQEAIPVGACAALSKNDRVVATYRGHGWALAWGLDPQSVMSEICQRADGLNGGRAGSAMLMAPETGFIGENSIVGAGGPIANGVAMAAKIEGGVVAVSFGDGAMSQGALHEAMVFATARKLPVIFVCENNGWSEMTQTSKIVPLDRLSKRASAYGMPGATIDGGDPVAVRDTIALAAKRARSGDGPSFIECRTTRLWGHYNRDIQHYRSKEDRQAAEAADPLPLLRARLLDGDVLSAEALISIDADVEAQVAQLASNALAAPAPDAATARDHVFSPETRRLNTVAQPEGKKEVFYWQAVNEALSRELRERESTVVFGEDVGHAGGIFGCTRYIQKEFGEARIFDTPIAESAILGAAVGAAMSGMRPVVEIMWADFSLVALDQIVNQAANISYLTRGGTSVPLVVRMQQGATPGSCAQHSQSLEAIFAHVPGLKVGLPSSPADAYTMLRAAIADPDPCIIIEARGLYQTKAEVDFGVLEEKVGDFRQLRDGDALTIVTWGTLVSKCAAAAEALASEGLNVSVIDLRWLSPLDWDKLSAVVMGTNGKALVVHEASLTGGFGAEVAARLAERGAVVARIGSKDTRIPAAPELQAAVIPSVDEISARARELAVRQVPQATLRKGAK